MAKVKNIPECGVAFSDTLSACDSANSIRALNKKHRKTLLPNLSSTRVKLVSTDLLGYAYMAKYTDHHSRVKAAFLIGEPPSVPKTADSATSQVRARQLALRRQGSPKQQFDTVSKYTRGVRMDKTNRPVSISVPNTYPQSMASPQAEECKPSATSA